MFFKDYHVKYCFNHLAKKKERKKSKKQEKISTDKEAND